MNLPHPDGFPVTIRLPLGIVDREPPAELVGVTSSHIPQAFLMGLDVPGLELTATDRRALNRLRRASTYLYDLAGVLP